MRKRKRKMDFKRFCALVKKYVLNTVELDDLHEHYVDFKNSMQVGYMLTATEYIINAYEERTLNKHGNCLKRNKNKKQQP